MLWGFCVSVANTCRRLIGNVLSSAGGDGVGGDCRVAFTGI